MPVGSSDFRFLFWISRHFAAFPGMSDVYLPVSSKISAGFHYFYPYNVNLSNTCCVLLNH